MHPWILLIFLSLSGAPGKGDFAERFLDKGLLLEFYQYGNGTTEGIALHRMVEIPRWGGPRTGLAEDGGLGSYRFRVFDGKGERLLLSRGFCTLFGEWRTTASARAGVTRVFEHALIMPYPKGPVRIEIAVRDRRRGTFRPLLERRIAPDPARVHRDNPFGGLEAVKIRYTGPPAERLDLVFLGDGYRAEERGAFLEAARKAAEEILSVAPFKENAGRINFWAVACPSPESGVDEPLKGIYRRTPFDTSFNTFDLPRYALSTRVHALFEAASAAPCDLPVVLFNSPRFGGGGLYNLYAMVSGSPSRRKGVLVHELGHALGGLADEYYTSQVSYVAFYPEGVEPWEPNITACLPGRGPKWADLIAPGVPVPTPDTARFDGVTGCFEGAGYRARGLFRPRRDCIMKSCRNGFCPVCTRALLASLRRWAP